ncbi:MAG TPA: TIGR03826 family flagellar region protein [Sporosarcina sp.]|nr:TIGR03826 family flagellar region protein [Sporosarcina sp.]
MRNEPEIKNCPSCGNFFNATGVNDVCYQCSQKEEKRFEEVSRYLRRRENRAATVEKIVKDTGVEQDLLYKWVRKGRLQPTLFPNIGAPCERCGELTTNGQLCKSCMKDIRSDLTKFEAAEEFKDALDRSEQRTYFSKRK